MSGQGRPVDRGRQLVEWRTVGVLVVFAAAWGSLVWRHGTLPWPVELAFFAVLGGMWMSLQHEMIHDHPARSTRVNDALGFAPLQLWIPFSRYKDSHTRHHRAPLTDPEADPESFYVLPEVWQRAGRVERAYLLVLRTIVGRLTIGPFRSILRFWQRELRACRNDRRVLVEWALHLAAAATLAYWLFAVVGVSPWTYVFGFSLGGMACTMLRSFAEHAAVPEGSRSAVVKAGPLMSLLYLNNNLHNTHHTEPDLPWYRLPARHAEVGGDASAAAGAGLYEGGYWEVVRSYLFTPFCQPDHPLSEGARPYGARGLR